jgi:hypothetical protein
MAGPTPSAMRIYTNLVLSTLIWLSGALTMVAAARLASKATSTLFVEADASAIVPDARWK